MKVILPQVNLRVFTRTYYVFPILAIRSRELATCVSKACQQKVSDFVVVAYLLLVENLPLNLWITSEPSSIRIRESADVTRTSDGFTGENYIMHQLVNILVY